MHDKGSLQRIVCENVVEYALRPAHDDGQIFAQYNTGKIHINHSLVIHARVLVGGR